MKTLLPLLLLVSFSLITAAEKKPNVIFILTDDQGWNDAHFAGHPYVKTPNLDKFASQSTWFRQFYVAATVCSPSRTAFMTSHNPARHFVHGHFADHAANAGREMPDWLDPQVTTLPGLLKTAGYATAHFGKWHLGHGDGAPPPQAYGVDVSKTVNANGDQLGDEKEPYFRAKSTALIVDETIKFIREHKEGPFYANVWTLLPHAPLKPTPEQLKVYENLAPKADDPAFGPWMQKYLAKAKDLKSQMQVFCASLTDLDTQLGRLFAALDEMKLADNTIIFYSSDNGAEDYRIGNASNGGVGNTGPLRARKRSMYEGGIRTFGLLRWPGKVAAGHVDETSVIGGVDFLPTICKLTGVEVPASVKPDGEDVSDIWLGASRARTKPLNWEWLFNVQGPDDGYMPPMLAVRDGDWKLFVSHKGGDAQLYNIPKDAGEEHDVASEHPDVVKSLTEKALTWAAHLPPSPARDRAAASGKPQDNGRPGAKAKAAAKGKTNPAAGDRHAIFKQKDVDHDGKLTLEEYLKNFPDQAEGKRRFPTFDTDHDGVLTEEEFVKAGKR
ncbi:MAG: sulfatase-like hydrolase/transferase [Verrucomicrobiaceae bacterium]|nr:sulfatase-like hydrolase/transferase [Verrucomicrobiaceae bacterium]